MARFLSIALLSFCCILTVQADIYSASTALSRGDYETAVKEFTRLAEKGDANAQANLGYMYYAGEGVPQDYEKAVYWYRKAATQGNKDAQYNLAVSYAFGEGAKQDLTEAAIWYRRAGEQGHVVSQYSLAISYAYGEGVPQDQKEATRWFKKAAELGYARAQVNLGSMYHTGEGLEQNYAEAAHWYRMAADRGDATAQYNLGTLYRSGKGVEQNYAQAKRWFRQSADQGYAAAQNELASLERSAAANVATQTIQTKPELPTSKTTSLKVSDSKKKPLFSVEKEGLLTLEASQLDIAGLKITTEEIALVETVTEEISADDTSITGTAGGSTWNTGDTKAPSEYKTTESSKGFFSALGRVFSSKNNNEVKLEEIQTVYIDNTASSNEEIVAEEVPAVETSENEQAAEIIEEESSEQEDSIIEPEELVETVALDEPTTEIEKETTIEAEKMVEDAPGAANNNRAEDETDLLPASTDKENKPARGLFSAIGNFFSGSSKTEETPISESKIEDEDVLIAKIDEPAPVVEEIELAQKAETDLSEYSVNAGRSALANSDFDEALKQFKPLAEAGDSEAQSHLGSLYYVGKGVSKDLNESYKWYKKSASQGNMDAQYSIGNMYLLGESVEQNNTTAATWYTLASEQGHIPAKNNLKSLKKLEALNRENQLKLDALTTEQQTKEDVTELQSSTVKTNVYAAGESPAVEPLQIIVNEETIEDSQIIPDRSDTDFEEGSLSSTNSPGFFKSLFGNDDVQPELSKEIESIDTDSVMPEKTMVVETEANKAAESVNTQNDVLAETMEEQAGTEKSAGLFGFIGNIFSSDKNNKDKNIKSESVEEIAMFEPEIKEISIDAVEETIMKEVVDKEIITSEIEKLRPLAIQGDQDAQYKLATLYYSGSSIKQDYSQAASWYRRAAQQGNVEAQYSLGNIFLMGEGINQDDRQAAQWYALAAEQGHESAKHNLENIQKTLLSNPVVEIETTNNDQLINLDNENTVAATTSLDTSGKPEYEQGLAYAFGDGVAQNDQTAFNLFYESAEKGYVLAQYKLGVAFAYGEGVRQDQKKAAEWYRKSAEQGYTIAQRNLAMMYLDGKGVKQNKIQALAWYQVVANAGNAMDLHRRDMLKKELTKAELSESQELSKQISRRLSNPSL